MEILIKPVITEKMTSLSEDLNQYGFIVAKKANKVEIKKAVEERYGVRVTRVNTSLMPGKKKSRYTKAGMISGSTGMFKKAVVTVAEGEMIDFYSNI
jgi:large subunit ribosomal protein L23